MDQLFQYLRAGCRRTSDNKEFHAWMEATAEDPQNEYYPEAVVGLQWLSGEYEAK